MNQMKTDAVLLTLLNLTKKNNTDQNKKFESES
jgi:hypothetical protein